LRKSKPKSAPNKYHDVKLPDALKSYLTRVGASVQNFKRFSVIEYAEGGYPQVKCYIKLTKAGVILCSNKTYEPSAEEAQMIADQMAGANFPQSIESTKAGYDSFVAGLKGSPQIYPIWSRRKKGHVVCAQQRIDNEDGSKNYILHTQFSDGNWYSLEPDGALPFYKPEKPFAKKMMVHEGAKAAMAAEKLSTSKTHPWAATLAQYEHWGTLGGAKRTPEMDYEEIELVNPEELVYVCDNDPVGVAAGQSFSQHIGEKRKLFAVRFEVTFPVHFDIADELPKDLFRNKGKNYVGPSLSDLMKPATWATKRIFNPETEKESYVLREQFKKEWLHTVDPEFFIHRDFPGRMLTADAFNSEVRPYSDVQRVDNLLRKVPYSKADSLDYMPDRAPGVHNGRDGLILNSYRPSLVLPVKGDPKPWLEYTKGLVPNPTECTDLLRWCATLIACPHIRMQYSVLLISETHGIGKTTLGEKILMPLVGKHNTSFPSESELTDSQFNTWCAHKRLLIVNEIYSGNSSKVYQRLKSVVADDETQINQKYVSPYRISNWCHVVASSNSLRALKLENEDRRWFIPEVSESVRPKEYWVEFNRWLVDENGLGIIMQWAIDYVKKNGPVVKGDHAPKTSTKGQILVEGFSSGQTAAYRLAQRLAEEHPKGVVLDRDLVEYVKLNVYNGSPDRCEKALLLRNAFKAAGWLVGDKTKGCKDWRVGLYEARTLCLDPKLRAKTMVELASEGIKPVDLTQYNVL
jgi:hypothetical protein